MATAPALLDAVPGEPEVRPGAVSPSETPALLQRVFGVELSIADGTSGEMVLAAEGQPALDWSRLAELCRQVARGSRPELLADEPPLAVLAVPLPGPGDHADVAVGVFLTEPLRSGEEVLPAAAALGMDAGDAADWAIRQTPWAPESLLRVAGVVLESLAGRRQLADARREAESLSDQLASTYEEISLLYRLTQNLKLSERDDDLGRIALEWLAEVVPARGLALQLVPPPGAEAEPGSGVRSEPVLLTHGDCPVVNGRFTELAEHVELRAARRPVVLNHLAQRGPDWPFPEVRQLVAVPLAEGENVFGWLAVFNHVDDDEFGTVEASLLNSVAAILGIHSGNIELYRQQSELLAGIVRALSSAIDAKDPYTCGHSDRVARVSVRLAQEMGCDKAMLNTVYLSGLLHDIGKIGIDDAVLRKPGKLTDEEYEHIKTHVVVGHRILQDIKKLGDVLPTVLHHHESWDGRGYPGNLPGEEIPLAARIVCVADSFDAMGSDRPYRQGMPDEKIDGILRSGAGKQWDPEVIDAFFRARDDIRRIAEGEEDQMAVELPGRV